jgi:hypothetical protein
LIDIGLALRLPPDIPDPLTGMSSAAFEALLTTETLPLSAPAVCGTKVTAKAALCPAANVNGRLRPLKLRPAPVVVNCDTVTLDPPEFESVMVALALLPTATLPKFTAVGFAINTPADTAVPEAGIARDGLLASLTIVTVPFV